MVRMYTIFWGDERANVHPFTGYSDVKTHLFFFSRFDPAIDTSGDIARLIATSPDGGRCTTGDCDSVCSQP